MLILKGFSGFAVKRELYKIIIIPYSKNRGDKNWKSRYISGNSKNCHPFSLPLTDEVPLLNTMESLLRFGGGRSRGWSQASLKNEMISSRREIINSHGFPSKGELPGVPLPVGGLERRGDIYDFSLLGENQGRKKFIYSRQTPPGWVEWKVAVWSPPWTQKRSGWQSVESGIQSA